MWKFVFAVPLIMHGLANLAGFFEAFGKSPRGFSDRPWIFSPGVKLQSTPGRLFGLLWLFSTLRLVGTGLAISFGQSWWASVTLGGAICSLLAIFPWWNTVVPGARFAAFFDLAVIVILLSPLRGQFDRLIGG
jgi:hypothetical protein